MKKFQIIVLTFIVFIHTYFCSPAVYGVGTKIAALDSHYFQGHAEITDKRGNNDKKLFTGEVDVIDKKTEIKMTVSQVLSVNLSEEGDEFFAEITNGVEGSKGLVLPHGTIAHGTVRKLVDSKYLGRDGYIELSFDYLVTPDGREVPIEGKVTTKLNPVVATAKVVAEDLGYTAAGGFVGGMMALQGLGVGAAVASHGYTVAGGAAVGGAVGLGLSLMRKGAPVIISPGDEIKVKLLEPLKLDVMHEDAFKQDEIVHDDLKVKINNVKLEKDPFGELNTITLQVSINNFTDIDFSSYDIGLMNDYNKVYHPSIFKDNSVTLKPIKSGARVAGCLSFAVDNPKRKHWLVFYDRRSRSMISKISVDNAQLALKKAHKNKHKS